MTGGLFSAALSVGSRLPGVTWHSAQWSPDFPPSYLNDKTATVQSTLSPLQYTSFGYSNLIRIQTPAQYK